MQERIYTTTTVTPFWFDIRHNLTVKEFNAIFPKWERTSPTHSQVSLIHLINHYTDRGWKAFDPADPYHNIPAFSNSRLGSIKNQLQNRTELPSRAVFVFGTALHELLLQPQLVTDDRDYFLSKSKLEMVYRMRDAALASPAITAAIQTGSIEEVVCWTDPHTGLPCKGKLDLVLRDPNGTPMEVWDFKTTNQTEIPEFLQAAECYEYTRQAAFYLDATGANTYRIIGITKTAQPKILELVFDRNEPRIQAARTRYRFILQKALALGIRP